MRRSSDFIGEWVDLFMVKNPEIRQDQRVGVMKRWVTGISVHVLPYV